MKIFKKTKAKKDARIAAAIKNLLNRVRLKERIDQANKWAEDHKKKVTVITISTLTASLVLGCWLTFTSSYNEGDLLSGMAEVKPAFDGMRRIQRLKNLQVDQTIEMTT